MNHRQLWHVRNTWKSIQLYYCRVAIIIMTTAKHVAPKIHHTQGPRNHPSRNRMVSSRPLLLHAAFSERIPFVRSRGVSAALSAFLSLMTLTFNLWPWHSNSFERGINRVFAVNLAQIPLAVPEIFEWLTNKEKTKKTSQKSSKNRTLLACGNYNRPRCKKTAVYPHVNEDRSKTAKTIKESDINHHYIAWMWTCWSHFFCQIRRCLSEERLAN